MTTTNNEQLLKELYAELADIERQQQDPTLPHSDQQLLDQAWEDITNKIDALEESFEAYLEHQNTAWQDAEDYLEEEEEEEPPAVVTIAPPPPSRCDGAPPPSPTRLQSWVRSDGVVMTGIPPSISIPKLTSLVTAAPPAPRAGQSVSVCNCDADGICSWCEERMNEEEDARSDCRYCSGCAYCSDSNYYDPSGEI